MFIILNTNTHMLKLKEKNVKFREISMNICIRVLCSVSVVSDPKYSSFKKKKKKENNSFCL